MTDLGVPHDPVDEVGDLGVDSGLSGDGAPVAPGDDAAEAVVVLAHQGAAGVTLGGRRETMWSAAQYITYIRKNI